MSESKTLKNGPIICCLPVSSGKFIILFGYFYGGSREAILKSKKNILSNFVYSDGLGIRNPGLGCLEAFVHFLPKFLVYLTIFPGARSNVVVKFMAEKISKKKIRDIFFCSKQCFGTSVKWNLFFKKMFF